MDTTTNNVEEIFSSITLSPRQQLELDNLYQENAALKKLIGNISERSRRDNYDNTSTINKQHSAIEKLEIEINALRISLQGK